jgi:hypothetical protein
MALGVRILLTKQQVGHGLVRHLCMRVQGALAPVIVSQIAILALLLVEC